jgi:hypothetical protein
MPHIRINLYQDKPEIAVISFLLFAYIMYVKKCKFNKL